LRCSEQAAAIGRVEIRRINAVHADRSLTRRR
jgi:hypothetical protein